MAVLLWHALTTSHPILTTVMDLFYHHRHRKAKVMLQCDQSVQNTTITTTGDSIKELTYVRDHNG